MIERSTVTLNALQQRIVAALQVDGRAPWKRIAEVIREPERTVARHGTLLLDDGVVIVASTNLTERQLLVTCDCPPGAGRIAAEALAQLPETTFSYVTAGVTDVIAEVSYHSDTNELITRRLPAVPGTTRLRSVPVLKYFKTIRGWRSGMLTDEEERALEAPGGTDRTEWRLPDTTGAHDEEIKTLLSADGRASIEAIARQVRMSESSVSRRISWLISSGQISIRALVEPRVIGLAVEAILWVDLPQGAVEPLGNRLKDRQEVRYLAAVGGPHQLAVDVTLPSIARLYDFLAESMWSQHSARVQVDLVAEARKRGGRILPTSPSPTAAS